jgi:hypothetical protein
VVANMPFRVTPKENISFSFQATPGVKRICE